MPIEMTRELRPAPSHRSPPPRTDQIIGGMFGMETPARSGGDPPSVDLPLFAPPFLEGNCLLLANGRSAIRVVTDSLAGGNVWLPSYLCAAILSGVADQSRVRFYPVDCELHVSELGWLNGIRPGDIVLIIDYFGFPCSRVLCEELGSRRAWLVKDASHALLSQNVDAGMNFVVYSPRKILAVPDGGVLAILDCDDWPQVGLSALPTSWTKTTLEAFLSRAEFDLHGGERRFFYLFQQADREAPVGPFAMSGMAEALLRGSFDYAGIARKRRENYAALGARLGHLAILAALPEGVVPLGFPIRVRDRDRLREALFQENIFPPAHWPVPPSVPREFSDSYTLADESLTLVCDQRCGTEEMERTCDVVLRHATTSIAARRRLGGDEAGYSSLFD